MGGPVSPSRLFQAAQWAVETYNRAKQSAPKDHLGQRKIVEEAHLAELGTTRFDFDLAARHRLRQLRDKKRRPWARTKKSLPRPQLEARRWASNQLHGDRAHKMLAAEPMPEFQSIQKYAFQRLAGERFVDKRSRIAAAAKAYTTALQRHRPVLLVLYEAQGKTKDEYDRRTKDLLSKVFSQQPVAAPLRMYRVIKLPLRELAALSQVAEIPNYELTRKTSPVLILVGSDGQQGPPVSAQMKPDELAMQLWKPVRQSLLSRAESYAARGKISDAIRLLRLAAKSGSQIQRQRVIHRTQQLKLALADQWVKNGRKTDALVLLEQVQTNTKDEQLRQSAAERASDIQASL